MRTRKRLVVIGNGMAGARLVEDVIARDPGAFDITMFGDEPYGNYNRILLSGVLAGTHDPKDIFINPLAWYEQANVRLHAGVGVARIDRAERQVIGSDGTGRTLRRARHRHRQHRLSSRRSTGCVNESGGYRDGVFVFRTLDDCAAIRDYAARREAGRGDRRRAARARSGARAAPARRRGPRRPPDAAPDGSAARRDRRRDAARGDGAARREDAPVAPDDRRPRRRAASPA